jgi:hypothetical protein
LLNKEEQQLLDYKTQQYRLLNLLSVVFAMHFTGKEMGKLYRDLVERLAKNDFSTMAETHATSAGLKALCSFITADGIEECRKCCGGSCGNRSRDLVCRTWLLEFQWVTCIVCAVCSCVHLRR